MVRINGSEMDIAGKTIEEYLLQTNYNRSRVAVEVNGDIVPKSQYAAAVLRDGDIVEIVGFVGGG